MKTMKLFVVLIVVAVASLLSVPMATAAPEGPQSVLTYTAPYKIKLDKETFDCKIASHKFDMETGVGTVFFDGKPTTIRLHRYTNFFDFDVYHDGFYMSDITSVEIPEGVTSIDEEAFAKCSKLKSITIPNSVTSIGDYAFKGCSSLTSITIPNSVTKIGEEAFSGCTGELIVNCNIPSASDYDEGAFYDSEFTKVTIGNGVTSIGNGAFYGCSSLTSITIRGSVMSIDWYAFEDCDALKDVNVNITNLAEYCKGNVIYKIPGNKHLYIDNKEITELVIPNSVTTIGERAFYGCSSLKSITIGNSVTSIGYEAFCGCSSLTSITIPNSVTKIGSEAFRGCTGELIVNCNILGGSEYDGPFDDSEFTKVIIGIGVTTIGKHAFAGCYSLTSVTIPDSVTSIGGGAFYGCSSLTDVITPERWIGYAFNNISGLKRINGKEIISDGVFKFLGNTLVWVDRDASSVSIPVSVKSIASFAFEGCKYLENVNVTDLNLWLRSGVDMSSSDGWNLYHNGKLVTNVTIPNGVTKIADGQFCDNKSLTSITIPDSVTEIGNDAFYGCSSLRSIIIPASVKKIGSSAFYNCSCLGSITIPASVKEIGSSAFYNCNCLGSITIPVSVKEIGGSAFYNCSRLGSITIPASVKEIGESAFMDCTSLTSVTISNGVTKIGDKAFYDCNSLCSITVPASVKEIGESAFMDCTSLTSVTISNGVTKIGDKAFYDCDSLGSISIPASVAYIGSDVFTRHENCGTLYVYMNSATPPALGRKFRNYDLFNWSGDPYYSSDGTPIIYVPENALFAYRSADVWNQMADKIEPKKQHAKSILKFVKKSHQRQPS